MKKAFLALLLLPACAHAQLADSTHHAIGVVAEASGYSSAGYSHSLRTAGIYYKWRKKENTSYTTSLAYAHSLSDEPSGNKVIAGNTVSTVQHHRELDLAIAGFAVEQQRHFYKKVYLFAGLDWRAGYGSGASSYTRRDETWHPPTSSTAATTVITEARTPGPDVSRFLLYFSPSLGAKLDFKKISLGLSVMNYIHVEVNDNGGSTTTDIDFNTANLFKRLSVGYKF